MTDQSRINIPTSKWPDSWWRQIFSIAIAYPKTAPSDEIIDDTKATIIGMRSTLPCGKCRRNWRKTLEKHPLTDRSLSTRDLLFKWMCDRYREINRKRRSLSNSEIAEFYTNELFESSKFELRINSLNIIIIGAIIGIAALVYLRHK